MGGWSSLRPCLDEALVKVGFALKEDGRSAHLDLSHLNRVPPSGRLSLVIEVHADGHEPVFGLTEPCAEGHTIRIWRSVAVAEGATLSVLVAKVSEPQCLAGAIGVPVAESPDHVRDLHMAAGWDLLV